MMWSPLKEKFLGEEMCKKVYNEIVHERLLAGSSSSYWIESAHAQNYVLHFVQQMYHEFKIWEYYDRNGTLYLRDMLYPIKI